jgi:hypothetical protein
MQRSFLGRVRALARGVAALRVMNKKASGSAAKEPARRKEAAKPSAKRAPPSTGRT